MLNRLRVENFRAWREADLTFGKVTGFFGTNSAGKSSLLHLLLLLKQTRNATDRGIVLDFGGPSAMVNMGTFEDVVHQHDKRREIGWLLEWALPETLTIDQPFDPSAEPLFQGACLQTRCAVGFRNKSLWPRELSYRFAGVDFQLRPTAKSKQQFELATDSAEFSFVRNQGRPWPLPHPSKSYLFPGRVRNYFQNADFLGDFELAYENLMDSIYYLGPLREYPRREYHWAGSSPEDVGQRGERTMDAILAATARQETRNLGFRKWHKSFQEMIAHWLHDLGLIYSRECRGWATLSSSTYSTISTGMNTCNGLW